MKQSKQFKTHGYEYSVGLRMHHPSIDPKLISRKLKMRPEHSWRVGDQRMTLVGTRLEGHRQDTLALAILLIVPIIFYISSWLGWI